MVFVSAWGQGTAWGEVGWRLEGEVDPNKQETRETNKSQDERTRKYGH